MIIESIISKNLYENLFRVKWIVSGRKDTTENTSTKKTHAKVKGSQVQFGTINATALYLGFRAVN